MVIDLGRDFIALLSYKKAASHEEGERLERHIFRRLIHIEQQQEKIMSALTDLHDAVARLNASTSAELSAIAAKLASLPAGSVSDAEVAAVVTQLNSVASSLDAETAALAPPAG